MKKKTTSKSTKPQSNKKHRGQKIIKGTGIRAKKSPGDPEYIPGDRVILGVIHIGLLKKIPWETIEIEGSPDEDHLKVSVARSEFVEYEDQRKKTKRRHERNHDDYTVTLAFSVHFDKKKKPQRKRPPKK